MSKHKLSGYNPAPPPTGNTVPYSLYFSASDKYEIWAVPAAGGTPVQVTSSTDYDTDPDMSGDGNQIVFLRTPVSNATLYIVNSDGSGLTQIDSTAGCLAPHFSPANDKIVYKIGATSIFTVAPDGTGKTDITPSVGTSPSASNLLSRPTFNRDGTLIAFQVSRISSQPEELWVMNADGTGATKIETLTNTLTVGLGFSWAHGSDVIAYTRGASDDAVYTINADGTGKTAITTGSVVDPFLSKYAWSADDSIVFAVSQSVPWGIWQVPANGSGETAFGAPLDALDDAVGEAYPYLFNDRIYTVDSSFNLISTNLAGGDARTEDGDSGSNLFPELQSDDKSF